MNKNRYETVNTFAKFPNCNQVISVTLVIALLVVFFTAIQNNLASATSRIVFIPMFIASFTVLTLSAFVTSKIDPADQVMLIYLNGDRKQILNMLENCLYCQSCQSYVKSTSRHCKICNRCVDQFDHHCIWINNCIGRPNYRPFFTMIVSATAYLALFSGAVIALWSENSWADYLPSMIVCWFFLFPSLIFFILLLILVLLHCYLVYRNVTTFQFIMSKREAERKNTVAPLPETSSCNPPHVNKTEQTINQINNRIVIEVDQVVFQPHDAKTSEASQNSQSDQPEKPVHLTPSNSNKFLPEDNPFSNGIKSGTTPMNEMQRQLEQFYQNHRSLKLLIGRSIVAETNRTSFNVRSLNRMENQTKLIQVKQQRQLMH